MTTAVDLPFTAHDREVLRRLGARLADIGASAHMDELRRFGTKLNRLQMERPMIFFWAGGNLLDDALNDLLECDSPWARHHERQMRDKLFSHEVIGDDTIINPFYEYRSFVSESDYGVQTTRHWGNEGIQNGSMCWDPPLKRLPDDLEKLRPRTFTYDHALHAQEFTVLQEALEGVIPVIHGGIWYPWTMGLTNDAIDLIGLEPFLMAMYDDPDSLHALMTFLRDDCARMLDFYEAQGVLRPNNFGDGFMAAGGCFYTDRLPQADYQPGQPARLCDCWGMSESQATIGVSPAMFEEFVFPYQLPLISRFGLACYGCCEPLDPLWQIIKQIPNLHRVSVSPWSNQRTMADYLGTHYVFSRKPNPSLVSSAWDEEAIRLDLRETLEISKGLNVEIIMKDVITVCGEPWRYQRWVAIAREEVARVYGTG